MHDQTSSKTDEIIISYEKLKYDLDYYSVRSLMYTVLSETPRSCAACSRSVAFRNGDLSIISKKKKKKKHNEKGKTSKAPIITSVDVAVKNVRGNELFRTEKFLAIYLLFIVTSRTAEARKAPLASRVDGGGR